MPTLGTSRGTAIWLKSLAAKDRQDNKSPVAFRSIKSCAAFRYISLSRAALPFSFSRTAAA